METFKVAFELSAFGGLLYICYGYFRSSIQKHLERVLKKDLVFEVRKRGRKAEYVTISQTADGKFEFLITLFGGLISYSYMEVIITRSHLQDISKLLRRKLNGKVGFPSKIYKQYVAIKWRNNRVVISVHDGLFLSLGFLPIKLDEDTANDLSRAIERYADSF